MKIDCENIAICGIGGGLVSSVGLTILFSIHSMNQNLIDISSGMVEIINSLILFFLGGFIDSFLTGTMWIGLVVSLATSLSINKFVYSKKNLLFVIPMGFIIGLLSGLFSAIVLSLFVSLLYGNYSEMSLWIGIIDGIFTGTFVGILTTIYMYKKPKTVELKKLHEQWMKDEKIFLEEARSKWNKNKTEKTLRKIVNMRKKRYVKLQKELKKFQNANLTDDDKNKLMYLIDIVDKHLPKIDNSLNNIKKIFVELDPKEITKLFSEKNEDSH